MNTLPKKLESPKSQTPPLSESYHRARRSLALTSAILMAWEFVGIKIGHKAKIPLAEIPVTLLHPEVVPIAIFILVVYFGTRLLIEWHQCDPLRRVDLATLADARLSAALAILAIGIFLSQKTFGVRIAELSQMLLQNRILSGFVGGFLFGAFLMTVFGDLYIDWIVRQNDLPMKKSRIRLYRESILFGSIGLLSFFVGLLVDIMLGFYEMMGWQTVTFSFFAAALIKAYYTRKEYLRDWV